MNHVFLAIALLLGPNPTLDNEIINGRSPKKPGFELAFIEEFRFGADEDGDEYLWTDQNVDIAISPSGNILIADPKVDEIREFDKDGKFLRALAKQGPGPGELQGLNKIQFLADGRLAIYESKPMIQPRIQFWSKDLAHVSTTNVSGGIPLSATFSPNGELFAGILMQVDPQSGSLVTKTGITQVSDFKLLQEYSSFSDKVDFSQMGNPTVLADMIGNMIKGLYKDMGLFAFDAAGNVYIARTNSYEISKWSPDLKTKLMTIKKEYKPILNSKEEILAQANKMADGFRNTPFASMVNDQFINRIIEKSELPEIKPPVAGLTILPEGHILVIHDLNVATGSQTADLFAPAGDFLCSVTRPNWFFMGADANIRLVFQKGKAYVMETDKEDNNRLVRYAYKLSK